MANNIKHKMSINDVDSKLHELKKYVNDDFKKVIDEARKYLDEYRGMSDEI